jgi:ankyrin repeat protein
LPSDSERTFFQQGDRIKLLYFHSSEIINEDDRNVFRILIWAAFFGHENLVEKLIRMGYSPFLKEM